MPEAEAQTTSQTRQIRSAECAKCKCAVDVEILTDPLVECVNRWEPLCDACDALIARKQYDETRAQAFDALEATGAVSRALRDCALDAKGNPHNSEAYRLAESWAANRNVYLWGGPGTGKTYLARAMLRKVWESGRKIAECSARDYITLATSWSRDACWRKDRITNTFALLLDDVDKVAWNEDRLCALWELLDNRSGRKCVTLITSNMGTKGDKGLMALFKSVTPNNESIAQATLERMVPVLVIEMRGKSLRKNG